MRLDLPFLARDALAAGISEKRLRGPAFQRIWRGVYVSSEVSLTAELRDRAALLLFGPGARLSHMSAARALRAAIPLGPDVHVTVPQRVARRRVVGIHVHVDAASTPQVVSGLRVSNPSALVGELAEALSVPDLVALIDDLSRRGEKPEPVWQLVRSRAVRRKLRRAFDLACPLAESPMESRLRASLVLAGLPMPEVNWEVVTSAGNRRRLDLAWPAAKVAAEYDGRHHIEGTDQWQADLRRREELEADGWRLIVITANDYYRHPHATVRRVADALKAAGALGQWGLASEWFESFSIENRQAS